jgi:hypothetical protein
MKLKDIFICLDCDEVYKPEVVEFMDQRVCLWDCPSCGSQAVTILCRWLPPMETSIRHSRENGNPETLDTPIKSEYDKEKERAVLLAQRLP